MTLEAIASSIAQQGFAGLLSNLATSYVSRKAKALSTDAQQIKTDLNDHLHNTFNKCFEIKTILSDKRAEKTLSLYVDQAFDVRDVEVDQYTLIEKIKGGGSAVITGTGGGGKSMFMRYLWLSVFEDPRGKIPFFLELRQLNFLTHSSIEDFIFHTIMRSGSTISQANFTKALKSGDFFLFFDGFDEVNHDLRSKVEQMILSIRENYPNLTVIVTSRPDERFVGWHQFEIYRVKPLKKEQVRELIDKAPYSEEYKEIFLKQLDKLYATHQTFLATPLLAYMMLVTFSYNRDIPSKMYLFYEQAFDALYSRHDLTKGGYKRKLYTQLDRQEFIRLLSYFCLKGYYDEAFEFSEHDLNKTIDQAKSIEKFDANNEDFIKDMSESVCLIKKGGLIYSFTHRSFQEYFAANCIARVASRNIEKMFTEFSVRYNDSVMQMVYDINVDLFREKYLIPSRKRHRLFFERKKKSCLFEIYAEKTGMKMEYRISPKRKNPETRVGPRRTYGPSVSRDDSPLSCLFFNVLKITSGRSNAVLDLESLHRADANFTRKASLLLAPTASQVLVLRAEKGRLKFDGVTDQQSDELVKLVNDSGYIKYMRERMSEFYDFVNGEYQRYSNITKSFSSLF